MSNKYIQAIVTQQKNGSSNFQKSIQRIVSKIGKPTKELGYVGIMLSGLGIGYILSSFKKGKGAERDRQKMSEQFGSHLHRLENQNRDLRNKYEQIESSHSQIENQVNRLKSQNSKIRANAQEYRRAGDALLRSSEKRVQELEGNSKVKNQPDEESAPIFTRSVKSIGMNMLSADVSDKMLADLFASRLLGLGFIPYEGGPDLQDETTIYQMIRTSEDIEGANTATIVLIDYLPNRPFPQSGYIDYWDGGHSELARSFRFRVYSSKERSYNSFEFYDWWIEETGFLDDEMTLESALKRIKTTGMRDSEFRTQRHNQLINDEALEFKDFLDDLGFSKLDLAQNNLAHNNLGRALGMADNIVPVERFIYSGYKNGAHKKHAIVVSFFDTTEGMFSSEEKPSFVTIATLEETDEYYLQHSSFYPAYRIRDEVWQQTDYTSYPYPDDYTDTIDYEMAKIDLEQAIIDIN
jgi:hypothetical protein